jgi:hypothetical protein
VQRLFDVHMHAQSAAAIAETPGHAFGIGIAVPCARMSAQVVHPPLDEAELEDDAVLEDDAELDDAPLDEDDAVLEDDAPLDDALDDPLEECPLDDAALDDALPPVPPLLEQPPADTAARPSAIETRATGATYLLFIVNLRSQVSATRGCEAHMCGSHPSTRHVLSTHD